MDSPTTYDPDGAPWSFDQWFKMFSDLGLTRTEARAAAAGAMDDMGDGVRTSSAG